MKHSMHMNTDCERECERVFLVNAERLLTVARRGYLTGLSHAAYFTRPNHSSETPSQRPLDTLQKRPGRRPLDTLDLAKGRLEKPGQRPYEKRRQASSRAASGCMQCVSPH